MKLLHCINSPHIGGIERLVIELAISQKKQGIEVSIMLDTRIGDYYKYLTDQKIPVLDSKLTGGFDFSRRTFKHLKQTFSNFDIVHLHSFSTLRSLAAKKAKNKTIYTIHGLSKGIRKENGLKYFFRETLKKYFLNNVDVFVANSNHTLNLAKKHYGLKRLESKVILNGIKFPDNPVNHKTIQNELFTIGLVSRFTYRKRIDRLINAFKLFLDNDGIGKLVLVGDGESFKTVKKLIKKLGLEESIELTGYQNNVQNYFQSFDVCVHPSDNEGFGLVAVEAYLEGKPILAFNDSGGLKEVVLPLEPENILNNEKELAERLKFYSENRKLNNSLSEKRRRYAQENFSIERMERDYYNTYKTLIKE